MTSPKAAAFFDVDGTLAATNVLVVFASLQRHRLRGTRWATWFLWFAIRAFWFLFLDLYDRRLFNERFVQNYRGVTLQEIASWQTTSAPAFWAARLFPEAASEVRRHRAAGRAVVVLSGGMAPMLEPMVHLLGADALYATEPEVVDGRLTGRLVGTHPVNEGKAAVIKKAAAELGLALDASYAYADHYTDRFFLETVAHPTAVNPSRRLKALAAQRGWRVCRWKVKPTMA